MKELFKSKGMILFSLFIISIAIIDRTRIQKNASAENTNKSNYYQNNSSK